MLKLCDITKWANNEIKIIISMWREFAFLKSLKYSANEFLKKNKFKAKTKVIRVFAWKRFASIHPFDGTNNNRNNIG